MGILSLACIFSVVVVIDGPLLQRASTVISAPITDRTVPLKVSITPQIPHDYTGSWTPWEAPVSPMFNDTLPSINGPVSNHIEGIPTRLGYAEYDSINRHSCDCSVVRRFVATLSTLNCGPRLVHLSCPSRTGRDTR